MQTFKTIIKMFPFTFRVSLNASIIPQLQQWIINKKKTKKQFKLLSGFNFFISSLLFIYLGAWIFLFCFFWGHQAFCNFFANFMVQVVWLLIIDHNQQNQHEISKNKTKTQKTTTTTIIITTTAAQRNWSKLIRRRLNCYFLF